MKAYLVLWFSFLIGINLIGQPDWEHVYYPEKSAYGNSFSNSYDNGFLLLGRHGHNAVEFNWLIKTDINGQILWNKTFGKGGYTINLGSLTTDNFGNVYLCGSTRYYDTKDPIVIKLDSCRTKEWCKIISTPDISGFAFEVINVNDDGCAMVYFAGENAVKNRINVIRLSTSGEEYWRYTHVRSDTNISNYYGRSILHTSDNGFLITGKCYYTDPNNPSIAWSKPYFIKIDSTGVFEWETVVHKDVGGEYGGAAWNTTMNPSGTYFYSSIAHYCPDGDRPALLKLDLEGGLINIYDLVSGYSNGGMGYATFLNDTILAAGAGWGNTDDDHLSYAILIDTLGNILDSTELVQDIYGSILQIATDQKLAYMFNTFQNNQFDVYLRKLNLQLEDDTLYTYPFQYDTLCPCAIQSDTITQEGCGIIVGIGEHSQNNSKEVNEALRVFPNPASNTIYIRYPISDIRYSIFIYNLYGIQVDEILVPAGQQEASLDVSDYHEGVYIAVLKDEAGIIAKGKFVVKRN